MIVAISYGAVFRNNCTRHGLPTVTVDKTILGHLKGRTEAMPSGLLTVDIENQQLTSDGGDSYPVEIDPLDRYRLLTGIDDLALSDVLQEEIDDFQRAYRESNPWA